MPDAGVHDVKWGLALLAASWTLVMTGGVCCRLSELGNEQRLEKGACQLGPSRKGTRAYSWKYTIAPSALRICIMIL